MTELTPAQIMAIDKIHATIAERDRLLAVNAELVTACDNLTVISKHDGGTVVIGPVGWEQLLAALEKARK